MSDPACEASAKTLSTPLDDPYWGDLFNAQHLMPLLVLCSGVLLHSMNALLMSTVMPSAVQDIGGLLYMSWSTTGFLAASVIAASSGALLRAQLNDRRAYLLASGLFGLGALIAALAPNISVLIFGRIIQGLGGGFISSLAYIFVRAYFPESLWTMTLALLSGIWGISILLGPLIGGYFAAISFWRGAFYLVAALAFLLALLAARVLAHRSRDLETGQKTLPLFRLGLAATGIVLLSVAGTLDGELVRVCIILMGLAVFVLFVSLDRRAASAILPSDAFCFRSVLGLSLWILILLSIANDAFPIYGPMFLQVLRGMDPLSAGYFVAVEAMAWTVMAAFVASLPKRYAPLFVLAGPVFVALGLVGISLCLADASLWLLFVSIWFAGSGMGICFTYLTAGILAAARSGDGERAAAAIPTIQLVGMAIGAAFAGLLANAHGFSDGLSISTARSAAAVVPAYFAVFALMAFICAIAIWSMQVKQPRARP